MLFRLEGRGRGKKKRGKGRSRPFLEFSYSWKEKGGEGKEVAVLMFYQKKRGGKERSTGSSVTFDSPALEYERKRRRPYATLSLSARRLRGLWGRGKRGIGAPSSSFFS